MTSDIDVPMVNFCPCFLYNPSVLKVKLNKMYGKKLNMYKLFSRMNKEVCKAKTFISISAQKNCCLLS